MHEVDRTTTARELPWPYNGIINDLHQAVDHGCNYLAALGMVCWSEFIGREIAEARGQRRKSFACFELFVSEYMRYDLGGQAHKVYDTFRNGLAHEFAIKGQETAVATRIYALDPHERVPGLAYDPDQKRHFFFVEEFLRDFEAGLRRWLTETGRTPA
jgi:hypothetical protein